MDRYIDADQNAMFFDENNTTYIGRKGLSGITRISNEMLMLFSNCLSFLNTTVTLDKNGNAIIVYINGTPGKHLAKILKLYPFITFHIYDEFNPCDELITALNNVNDKNKFFNYIPSIEELTEKYLESKEYIYLISEYTDKRIRIEPNYDGLSNEELLKVKSEYHNLKEELIRVDAKVNISITKAVNARMSMLKFRPPHFYITKKEKDFEFFSAIKIIMPIFSDARSVNCRMIVCNYDELVKWNYMRFADVLNTWHYHTKEQLAKNPFNGGYAPLPNQLGNQFEISLLFSLIRDYYFTISHAYCSETDVLNLYLNFLIDDQCSSDEHCKN